MEYVFNKTVIGYNHIDNCSKCQDNSFSYQDDSKIIIGTCDGHGGNIYVRSDLGSKFACLAAKEILENINVSSELSEDQIKSIKIKLISRWNELVEQDYALSSFKFYELEKLSDNEKDKLIDNYVMAYGTTMNCCLITNDFIVTVSLGDGGIFLVNKNMDITIIEDEENVANITNSLCGEDAFKHMKVNCFKKEDIMSVLCVTDGVLNPYQSYENFRLSFIKPIIDILENEKDKGIKVVGKHIKKLGIEFGIGDDVSLAMCYFANEE